VCLPILFVRPLAFDEAVKLCVLSHARFWQMLRLADHCRSHEFCAVNTKARSGLMDAFQWANMTITTITLKTGIDRRSCHLVFETPLKFERLVFLNPSPNKLILDPTNRAIRTIRRVEKL
jgi:hypothetical protein